MAEHIASASGVQHGLIVNPDGSLNVGISGNIIIGSVTANVDSIFIQSGNAFFGYSGNEIIRKDAGSPAVEYAFSSQAEAFMIDNLGSAPIYFSLDSTANPAAGSTGFIDKFTFRSFDGQIGSISIQSSGITSSEVQVVRLS